MIPKLSRRIFIGSAASTALLPHLGLASMERVDEWTPGPGMPKEGSGTPKIGAPINLHDITDSSMRAVKQIGVSHVLSGGPPIPWDVAQLTVITERLRSGGLQLGNLMIEGFPNTLYGKPG